MLTFLGFAMVITFMFLIMTKRLSALIALIIVPILFALFGGFAPKIGPMMLEGITKLAPTGVMLMFGAKPPNSANRIGTMIKAISADRRLVMIRNMNVMTMAKPRKVSIGILQA